MAQCGGGQGALRWFNGVVVMMPLRGTVAEAVGRSGMALVGVTVP